ncbi:MAG TPA: hypothetical protein VES02_01205, partial [Dermatophilaceae bacterium]|nr:hypothetical protein [Dermatophilaceae bacterium]
MQRRSSLPVARPLLDPGGCWPNAGFLGTRTAMRRAITDPAARRAELDQVGTDFGTIRPHSQVGHVTP